MVVDAVVAEDLRTVTGTIRGGEPTWRWIDPLAELPEAEGDRDHMRLFPGWARQGSVDFDPATGAFTAVLPRRFGGLGATREGLFAAGGWLPQPLDGDGMPEVEWQVTVRVPEGATAVVGATVGTDEVAWRGTGERVGLAVLPEAVVTDLGAVRLVSRRPPRRRIPRGIATQLALLDGETSRESAVVVVAPLKMRLVRGAPGFLLLSDDAWRMTPGIRRFHDAPIRRGLASALTDLPSPFERSFVSAALADDASAAAMDEALKGLKWIPLVDQTLNDRSMPYATEVLEDVVPEPFVADDLVERFDPHWPGMAVVAQLDLRFGEGTADRAARALRDGEPVDPEVAPWLARFAEAPPVQDLTLKVANGEVHVRREAEASAVGVAVPVRMGDGQELWLAGDGPGEVAYPRPPRAPVRVDPDGVVPQTERRGESYPVPLIVTGTGSLGNISLSPLALDGFVTVNFRRSDDSRTVWSPGVYFGDQVLAEGRIDVVRMAGRPLDALRREHQVSLGPSVLWLDPRYAPEGDSGVGIAASLGYRWDTKGEALFPLEGHTITAGVEAGALLTSPERWTRLDVGAAGVVALHPRVAIAAQLTGARSDSDFPHKALDLGSLDGLLGVPIGTVWGRTRGTSRLELRGVPVRYADVPMAVLWGTELQLSAGVEAGMLESADGRYAALGATAGLGFGFDWAGAKPSMTGITAGWPLWTEGFALEPTPWPQIVVRSEQWF